MATLIACATGNFTASSSWATGANELDSVAGTTTVTTGNTDGQTFTPGAITVDGIALKIRSRASSPSGTFTVTLRNSTDATDVASVTVNVSDLPIGIDTNGSAVYVNQGWTFFKFGSNQLLTAGKSYLIRVTTSASTQVVLYRDSTAGNVSRILRTTTTAAPSAGDKLIISGELTAAATRTNLTITMDNTAATVFGNVSFPASLTIGSGGTLTFGTSASTNYLLTIAGVVIIFDGGTMNIGTSGTRMPSTSTATLAFDLTAAGDSGIVLGYSGTLNAYGATKTTVWTLMTANKVATNTTLTLASTSGWAANDALGIASTTRTASDCEEVSVSTVDSGTQVTLSAGLASAHSGTSPTQAEVINLTRNVKINGESTTLTAFIQIWDGATVACDYVELRYIGNGTTTDKQGTFNYGLRTAGSLTVNGCAMRDCGAGLYISATTYNWGSFTITSNVAYNTNRLVLSIPALTATGWTVSDLVGIKSVNTVTAMASVLSFAGTIADVIMAGSAQDGFTLGHTAAASVIEWDGITAHSNAGYGIIFAQSTANESMKLRDVHVWRNNGKIGRAHV